MRLGRLAEEKMRHILLTTMALALPVAIGSASWADVRATGQVSYVSEDAIEIGGKRILLTPESLLMSGGREVSAASLRRGMSAEAEVDDAGRLIELQVNGVVE